MKSFSSKDAHFINYQVILHFVMSTIKTALLKEHINDRKYEPVKE